MNLETTNQSCAKKQETNEVRMETFSKDTQKERYHCKTSQGGLNFGRSLTEESYVLSILFDTMISCGCHFPGSIGNNNDHLSSVRIQSLSITNFLHLEICLGRI